MTKRIIANHESEVPSMKRVGVIGGLGQWATLDILDRIFKASVNYPVPQYGNRGYPPMDIRMLNKAPMLLNSDGSYPEVLKPSPELLEAAKFVGKNSDFIIISANTPHIFAKEVEEAAGKTLLSIVDVSINEIKKRKYKRVGLTAIGLTLQKELFQEPLKEIGVESVVLPDDLVERLEKEGIYQLQEGGEIKAPVKIAEEALDFFKEQEVDGVVLGCTEIPVLLGELSNGENIINPSQLLAEAVVKKALLSS